MWLSLAALMVVQNPQRAVPDGKSETLPVYRHVQPGETRVEGLLRRIDCPAGRPVVFNLQVNGKPARYSAPTLGSVDFIAHDPDFRGPVQCGGKTPPDHVYLTSKTVKGVEQVIAVEFLPPKK